MVFQLETQGVEGNIGGGISAGVAKPNLVDMV